MADAMEIGNGSTAEFPDRNSSECVNITFVDLQQKLVSAWQEEMAKELTPALLEQASRTISVKACQAHIQGVLQSTHVDCIVSPANSFGLMDGGLDLEISRCYGGVASLVPVVRAAVADEWCGQQNVGTCLLVDAQKLIRGDQQGKNIMPRYIAHVPTMRVPKVLHPDDDIAYRCTWALLSAIWRHNVGVSKQGQCGAGHDRISSVLCAGFGTGAGQFPVDECARQMVLAVKHFAEATVKNSTTGVEDLRASSELLTLWDKAGKIEDAVYGFALSGATPSSPNILGKIFAK